MVYVTHDQLEAMTMADRIAVMDHGVLQQVGTPLEVYNNPANVFVARFIGAPGMNLLHGHAWPRATAALVVDLGPLGATRAAARSARRRRARALAGEVLYGFRPGAGDDLAATARDWRCRSPSSSASARAPSSISATARDAVKVVFDNDVGLDVGADGASSSPNRGRRCGSSMPRPAAPSGGREPWPRSPSAMSPSATARRSPSTMSRFTVEDNEFFCFFGPPLSGKSTILRLILGLETPDAGEILIDGKPVNAVSPAERNVAMVFQNLALFPHMTARENVRFPLVERKMPEAEIDRRVRARFRRSCISATSCTSRRRSCRAASGSAWPLPARWCAIPSPT